MNQDSDHAPRLRGVPHPNSRTPRRLSRGTFNSRWEIVGLAFNMTTGEGHAFLATPRNCVSGSQCDALAAPSNNRARPTVVLPENVRTLLQQRQGGRFGVGLMRPR